MIYLVTGFNVDTKQVLGHSVEAATEKEALEKAEAYYEKQNWNAVAVVADTANALRKMAIGLSREKPMIF